MAMSLKYFVLVLLFAGVASAACAQGWSPWAQIKTPQVQAPPVFGQVGVPDGNGLYEYACATYGQPWRMCYVGKGTNQNCNAISWNYGRHFRNAGADKLQAYNAANCVAMRVKLCSNAEKPYSDAENLERLTAVAHGTVDNQGVVPQGSWQGNLPPAARVAWTDTCNIAIQNMVADGQGANLGALPACVAPQAQPQVGGGQQLQPMDRLLVRWPLVSSSGINE